MTKSVSRQNNDYFRELLTKARKDSGLTQSELAKALGRPQSYVSKYELGERRLDVVEFLEIAGSLNVDPVNLIRDLQEYGSESRKC